MNDVTSTVGPALSADETKFFETGGESGIPAESSGADAGGTVDVGGGAADAGAADASGDQGKSGDAASKTVPLTALHEERTRRKDLDKQLREAQQKLANFEGRFAVIDRLQGGQQQQAEQPAGPPKAEDDIFGAVDALNKRLDATDAEKKAATEHTAFVTNYKSDAAAFTSKQADYKEAYDFLFSSRANELVAIGYDNPTELQQSGASAEQVQAAWKALRDAVQGDEIAVAQMAMSKGKSPAEIIYGLAKQRGYAKKEAAAADAAAPPSGAEKLDAIERGQAANKSLSNTGGNAGDQDMTAERLMSMPMDEFEAWCDKNPAKARRIMGG
ncbi:hypothetical protein [Bradyrhizobium sp. OK095]|uniref:hypothetical protein n=1 Tax=Bradyrhizobium sp. OK095 TaxID=1882760 RepID=UPI0008D488FD|nr:hypothetical protein [Bradyrhizobium sp. OK095]SEN66895.1 hypothetical protein SAMN05443254_11025 [Bradyrhizobium sp. OK095]